MHNTSPRTEPAATRPLLDWLLARHPETPRKRAKQWIQAGRVRVAGRVIRRPNETMADPGAALELLERHASALVCEPGWRLHPRVTLLHLDASLTVINKGPDLLSVPAPTQELSALSIVADFMAGKLRAREPGGVVRQLPPAFRQLRPQAVHRLDKNTSGLLCFALNPVARAALTAQWSAHSIDRYYLAYVEGRLAQPRGTWRHWVRLSDDELRQFILTDHEARTAKPPALEAITHYEVVAEFSLGKGQGFVSKLRLKLETGRKHQIRAQAAQMGHPLVGEHTYRARQRDPSRPVTPLRFPRQALHAESLTLEHPEQAGRRLTWTADLPADLQELEARLRPRRGADR